MRYPGIGTISTCRLRLDGSIDVGLTAGGYMSTLFWQGGATDEEAAFGTVVQTNILAPLHDHLAGVCFSRTSDMFRYPL